MVGPCKDQSAEALLGAGGIHSRGAWRSPKANRIKPWKSRSTTRNSAQTESLDSVFPMVEQPTGEPFVRGAGLNDTVTELTNALIPGKRRPQSRDSANSLATRAVPTLEADVPSSPARPSTSGTVPSRWAAQAGPEKGGIRSTRTPSTRCSSGASPDVPPEVWTLPETAMQERAMTSARSSVAGSRAASSLISFLAPSARTGRLWRSAQSSQSDAERPTEASPFSPLQVRNQTLAPTPVDELKIPPSGMGARRRSMRSEPDASSCNGGLMVPERIQSSGQSLHPVNDGLRADTPSASSEHLPLRGRALFLSRHFQKPPNLISINYGHTSLVRRGPYASTTTRYQEWWPQWILDKE
mmetsp:Transcript_87370/g.187353  ORF Transcript_87370/g.187353 Transcript_87370/m.187353 type:complete len:355 (+) Transcript_87370:124-1188(+)